MELSSNAAFKEIWMLDRDWDLLSFIEEQGFASLSQIKSLFFNNKKSNCSMRLKKLVHFKYLQRRVLSEFFYKPNMDSLNKSFFPHLLNLNVNPREHIYFINREYSKGYGKSNNLFKPSLLLHQLILNELRVFLDEEIAHKMLFNDPKLKILSKIQSGRNPEIVPDLSYEYDSIKVAVELERTMKGMVRYFNRFNFFRDSIYNHVIYYYNDECQLNALLKRAGVTPKFAFAHYKTPNELYSNLYGPLRLNDFIHKSIN